MNDRQDEEDETGKRIVEDDRYLMGSGIGIFLGISLLIVNGDFCFRIFIKRFIEIIFEISINSWKILWPLYLTNGLYKTRGSNSSSRNMGLKNEME